MKKIKEQQYQYMMTVLAVITMVLVIGIYMTEQRENEKLMVVTSKDYIKWVDYREFDSCIFKKHLAGRIKPAFFVSTFLFLGMLFYVIV